MPNFAKTVLTDSGYWYALYNPRDSYHPEALRKNSNLTQANIIVPWPCLYETFNTRFAKNIMAVRQFEAFLSGPQVVLLNDAPYKDAALEATFKSSISGARAIALVDMVLRLILEDINVKKHGLLTFNPSDFADLCRKYHIEMV